MSEVHAEFTAGMDASKYNAGVTGMQEKMSSASAGIIVDMMRTQRATEGMTNSVNTAARKMYALGNASAQLQDIAVQAQSGTKWLTIMTQQVPQLLSAFGPMAVVAGTVVAVGLALYSWASGAGEAAEQAKRLEHNAKAAAAALEKIQAITDKANQDAARASGKEESIDEKYKQINAEINAQERLVKFSDAAGNAKIAEARAAAESAKSAEKQAEAAKQAAKVYKEIDDVAKQVAKEREKLDDKQLTGAARMMQLGKEITESEELLRSGKLKGLEYEKESLKLAKAQLECMAVHRKLTEDNAQAEAKIARDQKEKLAGFDKINSKMEKMRDAQAKVAELGEKHEKDVKKLEIDESAARGKKTVDDISNVRAGISSADIRKSAIRVANEEKRAVDRQLAKEGVGKGLSGRERQEATAKRRGEIAADLNAAKNKDKLKAEIDQKSIKQLSDDFVAAVRKILPT